MKRYVWDSSLFGRELITFENVVFEDVDFHGREENYINTTNYTSFALEGGALPRRFFQYSTNLKSLTLPFPGVGTVDSFSNFGELFFTTSVAGTRAVTQYFEDGSTKTYYIPTSLEELNIAEGCGMIPYGGLSGCNMLKKLSLPTTLYMVGEKALYGCAQLADIHCAGADPAVAFGNSFDGMRFTSCKLHVPYNSGDLYKAAEGWKRFYNIQEEAPIAVNAAKNIENGGVIFGLEAYRPGQTAELRAVANSGYTFTGWYEGGVLQTTSDIYTFTVIGNRDLVAMFSPVLGGGPVTVTPTGSSATLSWPGVESAATYTATAYGDASMTTPVATVTVNAAGEETSRHNAPANLSVTFKGLTAETEYYYTIKANGADGRLLSQYNGTFATASAGVEDVIITPVNAVVTGYYNLQGVKADEPWPGPNIVVYSDGTTRKLLNR